MPKPPLNHMMLHDDELADEFEAIIGYRTSHEGLVLGGEEAPQDPADFPALRAWWQCEETEGTTLADWLYANTEGVSGIGGTGIMTITANGAGNPFATAGAFTTSDTGSNEVFARTALRVPRTVSGQLGYLDGGPLMVEIDAILLPPASSTRIIAALGRATNIATNQGWRLERGSAGNMYFVGCGATTLITALNWTDTEVQAATGRNHWLYVLDRANAADVGTVSLYLNGTLVGAGGKIPSGALGTIQTPASDTDGRFAIGVQNGGTLSYVDNTYYNLRVWHPAAIPAEIAVIAQEMAATPGSLPAGMTGVA